MVVAGAQIIGRAFVKALQSEVRASQQAAQARSSGDRTNIRSAAADALSGITLQVFSSVVISLLQCCSMCILSFVFFTILLFICQLYHGV